ncbi:hypothetical protein [Paraclostridium bifermentans]|uniref:hypothetical protein n=1 Tax=Paraclostridium bifermentans TaxID=1490 RepID=UPI00241D2AD2|nr:hypothetical protein [Paraclostridium bifermentans]
MARPQKAISELSQDYLRKLSKEEVYSRINEEEKNKPNNKKKKSPIKVSSDFKKLLAYDKDKIQEHEVLYNQIKVYEYISNVILEKMIEEGIVRTNMYNEYEVSNLLKEYMNVSKEKAKLINNAKDIISINKESEMDPNEFNMDDIELF